MAATAQKTAPQQKIEDKIESLSGAPALPKAPTAEEIYTVKPGDSFARICFLELNRKDWSVVAEEIGIKDPSNIKAGQKIDFRILSSDNKTNSRFSEHDNQIISETARRTCTQDNAFEGQCSKGVMNVLQACGIRHPYRQGEARLVMDQLERLAQQPDSGWCRIKIDNPKHAPDGSILCYDRNKTFRSDDKSGRAFGHIEIVAHRGKETSFISDKARPNNGGTVKHNWDGYAYVYKGNPENFAKK